MAVSHRSSSKLRKDLSESEKLRFGAGNVGTLFSKLNTALNEVWEDYVALNFYLSETHKQLKQSKTSQLSIPRLVNNPRSEPLGRNAIFGIISRIRDKASGRHAFIDGVSLFENFMSKLVYHVYMDFPGKLKG